MIRSASFSARRHIWPLIRWVFLLLAFAALATVLKAQQKINPNTQINWPAGCGVYNVSTNTCPPVGGINFRGAWSSVVTYAVNDAVFESGSTYVSLQAANLNHDPISSPTFWTLFATGGAGTPGGPNLSIQFNNGGTLGGTAAIATDSTHQALYVNATNPALLSGVGVGFGVNGSFTGIQQNPEQLITNSLVFNQRSWNYGNSPNAVNPLWGGARYEVGSSTFLGRGINNHSAFVSQDFAGGDFAGMYGYAWCDGGWVDSSGEGCTGLTLHAGQNSSFMTGTVDTGATTGSQLLPVTGATRVTSDGAYLLDLNLGAAGSITGPLAALGSTGLFVEPVSGSFTASAAYGTLSCTGGGLPQPVPGNTLTSTASVGVTCTVSGIQGTNAGGFTTGVGDLAAALPEQVVISAVGTISAGSQTVVLSYRNPHANVSTPNTMMLFQGGEAGTFQSIDSIQASQHHFRTTFNVFGATDSTHLVVGCAQAGILTQCPNPYQAPSATTNLVQTGTTVTATGGGAGIFNLQPTATIAGCSASSLNGTVTNVLVTAGGNLQWTAAGSGSATCPTATISLPQLLTFHVYPGAEVAGPAIGASIPLEPNTVAWSSGHSLENPLHYTFQGSGDWLIEQLYNSNSLGFPIARATQYEGEGISGGYQPHSDFFTNPCGWYAGCGGNLIIPSAIHRVQGQAGSFLLQDIFPLNGILFQVGCWNAALGGCGNTSTQTIVTLQGGVSSLAVTSWAIVSDKLTITFVNSLPNGQVLTPTGGQQLTLSGFAEDYLNTVLTATSATSTTVTAPIVHADASATESAAMSVNGEFFQGDAWVWNPNTREAVFPNVRTGGLSVSKLAAPKILLGNTSIAGEADFSNDGITVDSNIRLCNLFSTDGYIAVNLGHPTGPPDCSTQIIGGYTPTGSLGMLNGYITGSAQINLLQVGRGTPINIPSLAYTGAAGSVTRSYIFVIENAQGQEGNMGTGGAQFALVSNTATTLDGSHFVTITCPTALQAGLVSGDTYVAYAQDIGSGAVTRVGACPLTSTLVDNGSATSVAQFPLFNANSVAYAGSLVMAPTAGSIRWLTDIYHTSTSSGLSKTSTGVSVDTTAAGDGLGTIIAASATFLQPATLTTTASASDNVTIAGMTASGHCGLSATNSTASANIATTNVSAKTTNQVTVTHTAVSGMTYDLVCSPY